MVQAFVFVLEIYFSRTF